VSTYAVLGLVDKVPDSSGYDLAAIADRSLHYFWPVSHTLMYRELKRLTDLGWVASHRVEQVVAPDLFIGEARRGRPRADRSATRAPGSLQE
jgi:DNA-binding PadR family transcriptional regulator